MKKWKIVKSQNILNTKWLIIDKNDYDIGNNVIKREYYDLKRPNYVLIIAKDRKENIVLVKQYRRGINDFTLELPSGWINQDETPIQATKRELKEETGYIGKAKMIGKIAPMPSFIDMTAYIIEIQITESKNPQFDQDETIDTEKIPLSKIKKMISRSEIIEMGLIAAINLYSIKK